jgi:hypothetical protein
MLDICIEKDLEEMGGLGKRCFQLAKVKQSPCSEQGISEVASIMAEWLVNHGSTQTKQQLLHVAAGPVAAAAAAAQVADLTRSSCPGRCVGRGPCPTASLQTS